MRNEESSQIRSTLGSFKLLSKIFVIISIFDLFINVERFSRFAIHSKSCMLQNRFLARHKARKFDLRRFSLSVVEVQV